MCFRIPSFPLLTLTIALTMTLPGADKPCVGVAFALRYSLSALYVVRKDGNVRDLSNITVLCRYAGLYCRFVLHACTAGLYCRFVLQEYTAALYCVQYLCYV